MAAGPAVESRRFNHFSEIAGFLRRIMYGIVLPGPDVEGGIPIVKGGDVKRERLKLESLSRTTPEIESRYIRSRLSSGDWCSPYAAA